MRKTILSLSAVLLAVTNAFAYDFTAVNNDGLTIYYNITSNGKNKTCEVAASPVADDYSQNVDIPSVVTYQGAKYSVTSIGQNAFSDCYDLSSVSIPDNVTSIGEHAFVSCTYLVEVFLPKSLTSIGEGAFASCTSLTSVMIPDGVTSIGDCAFYGCYRMESFAGKLASEDGRCLIVDGVLNSFAPAGLTSYEIPDYVTAIGNCVFSSCTSLTSVTIPDKVTSIGKEAFLCCNELASVSIPNSVVTIGDAAFSGCPLTSLTLPDRVTTIGKEAFSCCDIKALAIPGSVISIGESAFEMCDSLTSVVIPNSVTSIGSCVFKQCPSLQSFTGKYASEDGRCLIVDGVLNSFAPAGLTSYVIPESVTSIGYGAFWYCSNLTSLTIPDSVTTIAEEAFGGCRGLVSLTIPASVKSIGAPGFAGCSSLKALIFMGTTPPIAQYNAYANGPTETCVLVVPDEAAVKAYKEADYWRYFNNIVSAR